MPPGASRTVSKGDSPVITRDDAHAFLARNTPRYLAHLGALLYDPVRELRGDERHDRLSALAVVVDMAGAIPDLLPSVFVGADDAAALDQLLEQNRWPERANWISAETWVRDAIERWSGMRYDPQRGQCLFAPAADAAPTEIEPGAAPIRALTEADAEWLDLTPVSLSVTALRGWLRRGWRVYGAIAAGRLVCHALAAYPIDRYEEIAGVFTAPDLRGRGVATAVVRAVANDIERRDQTPFYVAARHNVASQHVARRAGLQLIGETWEVVVGQRARSHGPILAD